MKSFFHSGNSARSLSGYITRFLLFKLIFYSLKMFLKRNWGAKFLYNFFLCFNIMDLENTSKQSSKRSFNLWLKEMYNIIVLTFTESRWFGIWSFQTIHWSCHPRDSVRTKSKSNWNFILLMEAHLCFLLDIFMIMDQMPHAASLVCNNFFKWLGTWGVMFASDYYLRWNYYLRQ